MEKPFKVKMSAEIIVSAEDKSEALQRVEELFADGVIETATLDFTFCEVEEVEEEPPVQLKQKRFLVEYNGGVHKSAIVTAPNKTLARKIFHSEYVTGLSITKITELKGGS